MAVCVGYRDKRITDSVAPKQRQGKCLFFFFFLQEIISITVGSEALCLTVCFPQERVKMSGVSLHDPSIPTFLSHLSEENPCKNTK